MLIYFRNVLPTMAQDQSFNEFLNMDSHDEEDLTLNQNCLYYTYDELDQIEQHKSNLNILHLNIRGFISKRTRLLELLQTMEDSGTSIDIILLCETFMTKENKNNFKIKNYTLLSSENRTDLKQGGVAIFVKKGIKAIERKDLNIFHEGIFESCFIQLDIRNNKTIIGEVYRVPNTNEKAFMDKYTTILQNINGEKKELIIGLDQNIDYLKINCNKNAYDFFELNLDNQILPTITRPTRVTHASATLIDNINLSLKLSKQYNTGIILTDISDHFPCFLSIQNPKSNNKTNFQIKSRKLNANKIINIKEKLQLVDWNLLINMDTNNAYNTFEKLLMGIIDECAPEKIKIVNHKNVIKEPWFTPGLLTSSRKLNKLFNKTIGKPRDSEAYNKYIEFRNKYNSIKRKAKHNYYHNKIYEFKSQGKKMWKIINELIGKSNNKLDCLDYITHEGIKTYNKPMIANLFCNFFTNIGPSQSSKITTSQYNFRHFCTLNSQNSIFMMPTSQEEIHKIITSLKNKSSFGHDKINNTLIKILSEHLCTPLEIIFNKSLLNGQVPDQMKIAHIVPIHKSNSKHELNNYRPISLLTSMSKILEKIVHTRLFHFLNSNNLLNNMQFGFTPEKSTIDAVTLFLGKLIKNLENKDYSLGMFVDFSKAFDTLDHNILLYKLQNLGIRGIAYNWLKSYLTERKQTVRLYTEHSNEYILSDFYNISHGIPQGSILGPLLFIIYILDMKNCTNITIPISFADDTTFIINNKSIDDLYIDAYNILTGLYDYCAANKLSINLSKTKIILFKPRNKNHMFRIPDLIINNTAIERVEYFKFLGVTIDSKLNWEPHFNSIKCKLIQNLYFFNALKNILPPFCKKLLYYAHVYPHLLYGNILWGPMLNKSQINVLNKLQDKIVRTFDNKVNKSNTNSIYKNHNILKINDLIALQLGGTIQKIKLNKLQPILSELFNTPQPQVSYSLRNARVPSIARHTSAIYNKSFLVQAQNTWTRLPQAIKSTTSIHSFQYFFKKNVITTY